MSVRITTLGDVFQGQKWDSEDLRKLEANKTDRCHS